MFFVVAEDSSSDRKIAYFSGWSELTSITSFSVIPSSKNVVDLATVSPVTNSVLYA